MNIAPAPEWLKEWARDRRGKGKTRTDKIRTRADKLGPPPAHIINRKRLGLADCDHEQDRKAELISFAKALALIPANCSYEEFFEIGAGVYDYDPGPDGLYIFKSWAWQSERHRTDADQEACEKKWLEYQKGENKQDRITKASIYFKAIEIERQNWGDAAYVQDSVTNRNKDINGEPSLPRSLKVEIKNQIRFNDLDRNGRPKETCTNARAAIMALGIDCRHDVFHEKKLVGGHPIEQWAGELSDDAIHALRLLIATNFGFDPGQGNTHDAAIEQCLQYPFDPVLDYLDRQEWDRQPRVANWLTTYLGADSSKINQAIGTLVMCAAVRRVRQPGTKFDQITVLEGSEGTGKSSAINILAGNDNFSDQAILTLDERRQQEAIQGVWLYEIAEMAGISRTEIEKVKAFASRTHDRTRPAYGRTRIDRPRRCVFFATTNDETYLLSQTGNRRFWPVKTGKLHLEQLALDRDQLWAESVALEKEIKTLELSEHFWRDIAQEQDTRREQDPWDIILEGLNGKECQTADGGIEYRVKTIDLLDLWLAIPRERQSMFTTKRLAFTMRRLGWEGPKVFKEDGKPYKGYVRPVTTSNR